MPDTQYPHTPHLTWTPKTGDWIEGSSVTESNATRWRVTTGKVLNEKVGESYRGKQSHIYEVSPAGNIPVLDKLPDGWVAKVYHDDLESYPEVFRERQNISRQVIENPHEHIFPIVDGITIERQGRTYYVEIMPLCRHGSLREYAERIRDSDQPWQSEVCLEQVEKIGHQIGSALDHAHKEIGYAHCDVRDDNILVLDPGESDPAGFRCALTDFGVAKAKQLLTKVYEKSLANSYPPDGWHAPEYFWQGHTDKSPKANDFYLLGLTLLDCFERLSNDKMRQRVSSGGWDKEICRLKRPSLQALALCLLNGSPTEREIWTEICERAELHYHEPSVLLHQLQPSYTDLPKKSRPYSIALGICRDPEWWYRDRSILIDAIKEWIKVAKRTDIQTEPFKSTLEAIEDPIHNQPGKLTALTVAWTLDPTVPLRVGDMEFYSVDGFRAFLEDPITDDPAAIHAEIARLLHEGIIQEWVRHQNPDWLLQENDLLGRLQACSDAVADWVRSAREGSVHDAANEDALAWLALRQCWMPQAPFQPPIGPWPEACEGEDEAEKLVALVIEDIGLLDRWRAAGWLATWQDAMSLATGGQLSPYGLTSPYAVPSSNPALTMLLARRLGAEVDVSLQVSDVPPAHKRVKHGRTDTYEINLENRASGGMMAGYLHLEESGHPKFAIAEVISSVPSADAERHLRDLQRCAPRPAADLLPNNHFRPFVGNRVAVVIRLDPGVCSVRDQFTAQLRVYWNEGGLPPHPPAPPNWEVIPLTYDADINSGEIWKTVSCAFALGCGVMGLLGGWATHVALTPGTLENWRGRASATASYWQRWGDWHPLGPFLPHGAPDPSFYGLCAAGGLGIFAVVMVLYFAFSAPDRPAD